MYAWQRVEHGGGCVTPLTEGFQRSMLAQVITTCQLDVLLPRIGCRRHHVKKLVLGSGVVHHSHETWLFRGIIFFGKSGSWGTSAPTADEGLFELVKNARS